MKKDTQGIVSDFKEWSTTKKPEQNIRFRQTITIESPIAMTPREWEQIREYLEDNGYENVTLADAEVIK